MRTFLAALLFSIGVASAQEVTYPSSSSASGMTSLTNGQVQASNIAAGVVGDVFAASNNTMYGNMTFNYGGVYSNALASSPCADTNLTFAFNGCQYTNAELKFDTVTMAFSNGVGYAANVTRITVNVSSSKVGAAGTFYVAGFSGGSELSRVTLFTNGQTGTVSAVVTSAWNKLLFSGSGGGSPAWYATSFLIQNLPTLNAGVVTGASGAFSSLTLGGSNVMTRFPIDFVTNTDIRATTPFQGKAVFDTASNTLFIAEDGTTNGYIKFVGTAVP